MFFNTYINFFTQERLCNNVANSAILHVHGFEFQLVCEYRYEQGFLK